MHNFIDNLAMEALKTIKSGYYKNIQTAISSKISLKQAIQNCKTNAIITEIKAASPSLGNIRSNFNPVTIAETMQKSGAVGLSVLTEPTYFKGSLQTLIQARKAVSLPILMKDIIFTTEQNDAAANLGAIVILLIQSIFDKGYGENDIFKTIEYAHNFGLEVLLETHTEVEFAKALKTNADLIGINNRNLDTLKTDLSVTRQILESQNKYSRIIVSESGIKNSGHIQFLRGCGADAFLVGSIIMLTNNVERKVEELVNAL